MKKAFTLIELLVVIAIIGILLSIVVASLGSCKEEERIMYTEKYCNVEKSKCRVDCTEWYVDSMEDCLLKCVVRLEECTSKIGDYSDGK